jgi:hypothetical protein
MKKQELIHLHTLLAEVAGYCQEEGVSLDLSTYHAHDTHPMAVSHSKSDHEAAVLALVTGVAASLEVDADGEQDEPVTVGAD